MEQSAKRQLSVRLSVFLVSVCAVFLLIGGAAEADPPPAPTFEYVVSAGDTLWSVALAHSDVGVDVRRRISDIKESTGIRSSALYPGQVLQIPRG